MPEPITSWQLGFKLETKTEKHQEFLRRSHVDSTEQFTIKSLLYVTSLIASGLALWPGTILMSAIVIGFWVLCFKFLREGISAKWIIILLATAAVVVLSLQPTSVLRESHRHVACSNNVRQLALSMLNYESTYGEFPESTSMQTGHPFSWRLAVCPYIEQDQIHAAYDFSKPWNDTANMPLANQPIDVFECPSHYQSPKTPYKLVTGTGTVFDGRTPPTLNKITDGTSNTIVLIEDHSDFVFWPQPEDIDIEQAIEKICNLDPADTIHSFEGFFHTKFLGINVAFADGSVGMIGFDVDPDLLRSAFLCSDGKPLELKNRRIGKVIYTTNWGRVTAAVIYGFLILLPAWFLIKKKPY